jgi:type II secretory pathway predicted ATPase ExeA
MPVAKPIRSSSAACPYLRTPSCEEASARLHYLVESGSRVGLLTGAPGSGKTTLLERFHEDLRARRCLTAFINAAGLDPQELMWSIAVKLQANVEDENNLFHLWRVVNDRLVELRFLREQAVILVDDAGHANTEVLLHLYRFANAEAAADARLTIVLGTTRERIFRLGRPLLELADLRVDLPGFSRDETRMLVETSDRREQPVTFDPQAIHRLHDVSAGAPRMILRLAELARLVVEADGYDHVDAGTIDGVYAELGVQSLVG